MLTAPNDAPATILVVEDESLVAMLMEDILVEAGFRAVWRPSGDGADEEGIGAAVVDLRLADGLDGRDVLRRLRLRRPGLPALVVTGHDPLAPAADLRGLGGPTLRIGKPFVAADLLDGLAAVMASAITPRRFRRRATDA